MIKPKISDIDCWKTKVLACDSHPFESMIIKGDVILELNHYESINVFTTLPKSIIIEADPFLFVKDGRLYVFYESKTIAANGIIKMISTIDLVTWTDPVTVLTEKCHLSYPFVFEDNGVVYMVPETGALRSIRLYRATDKKLTQWEFSKTLIEDYGDLKNVDLSFCDSSILKLNDIYYLFTTISHNYINELHLYTSQSLKAPFQKHPQNPLVRSNMYGRNAGSIIKYKGDIWRVAQDCVNSYGENVNLAKIINLSPTVYKEEIYKDSIFNRNDPFYSHGCHQLNIVEFNNKFIAATDAKGYRKFLFQRLLSKIF